MSPPSPHRLDASRRAAFTLVAIVALAVLGGAATNGYVVREGDTLSEIADRAGTSAEAIARASHLHDPDDLREGQRLSIPNDPSSSATHIVRRGDTLSGIAGQYGMDPRTLAAINGISDNERVLAGSRLRLSGRPVPDVGSSGSHVVAPGESLSTIARRYGVDVEELATANGVEDVDRIATGARLAIPGGWSCPVRGDVSFVNDFGIAKPDGRFHDGVDVFAARGTAIVAAVSGDVNQVTSSRGGKQFWLRGDDGITYMGAHLDRFGAAGRVRAADVIGYVGTSGNAQGTSPHLHFEMRPDGPGTVAVNPYPALAGSCQQ